MIRHLILGIAIGALLTLATVIALRASPAPIPVASVHAAFRPVGVCKDKIVVQPRTWRRT